MANDFAFKGVGDIGAFLSNQTAGQAKQEYINRLRKFNDDRPIKNYDASTPIQPGDKVVDPSSGKWETGT